MIELDDVIFNHDIVMPVRSKLYNLPLSAGRKDRVESLLDYLQRLAHAHQLRVADLLTYVVLPVTNINNESMNLRGFGRDFARSTNGYGKYANEISNALIRLTHVTDLERGTFLHWQPLFDPTGSGLLYPKRRWCPCCLEQDLRSTATPIYNLAWASVSVTHCHVHGIPLVSHCLCCRAEQRFVSEGMAIGRCRLCGSSLGWRTGLFDGGASSEPGSREEFNSKSVEEMISLGAEAAKLARPEVLSERISAIAKASTRGSIHRLAMDLGVSAKTLRGWVDQTRKPMFKAFIEVCYRLGETPVTFLQGKVRTRIYIAVWARPLNQERRSLTQHQLREIEMEIGEITKSEDSYVSAKDLAAKHNTLPNNLKHRLPEAYKQLTTHRLRVRARLAEARVIENAEAARRAALSLHLTGLHPSRQRKTEALRLEGLSILCPTARHVLNVELHRLRLLSACQSAKA